MNDANEDSPTAPNEALPREPTIAVSTRPSKTTDTMPPTMGKPISNSRLALSSRMTGLTGLIAVVFCLLLVHDVVTYLFFVMNERGILLDVRVGKD